MSVLRRIALLLALVWLDKRANNHETFVFRGDETLSTWGVRVTVEIEREERIPVENERVTQAT